MEDDLNMILIHRATGQLSWWLFGLGLVAAAWWGQPLVDSTQFENHFFGVFWYSMLGMGAIFWALPGEQYTDGKVLERRTKLLGLLTLWRSRDVISSFARVELEQEPNIFGRDNIWLSLIASEDGETTRRFVFAYFSASHRGVAKASKLAGDLARVTGLPFIQPAAEA